MPRIPRVVLQGYPHHVTQRGTNKTEIFSDSEDRHTFIRYLDRWAEKTSTRVLAYCLMDNHFHLLLVPEQEGGLGKCLHGATFQYAQYFNQKYNRRGRLWQNRYFSCPINTEEYLWHAARYIEDNPVRAGLVTKAEDWGWSSARTHMTGIGGGILNLSDWLEEKQREQYRRFAVAHEREEQIRKATSTGRPLGNTDFYREVREQLGRDLVPKKGGRRRKLGS